MLRTKPEESSHETSHRDYTVHLPPRSMWWRSVGAGFRSGIHDARRVFQLCAGFVIFGLFIVGILLSFCIRSIIQLIVFVCGKLLDFNDWLLSKLLQFFEQ